MVLVVCILMVVQLRTSQAVEIPRPDASNNKAADAVAPELVTVVNV